MGTLDQVLERSRELGFLGPGPVAPHVAHGVGLAVAAERLLGGPPPRVCDLGAGGGVPGLVVAHRWASSQVVLLEASTRRCAFLREAVAELDLGDRVTVAEGRAEALAREPDLEGTFPLVLARSFGPPAVTAECGARLLSPGGRLLVADPPQGADERWPQDGLALLGLEVEERTVDPSAAILRARSARPERFPRRPGIPSKRPLF